MLKRSIYCVTALLIFGLASLDVTPATAQHVRYETVSKMEVPSLGFLSGLIGKEQVTKTSVRGDVMREDVDKNFTITDLNERHYIHADEKREEYYILTFEEMMEMFSGMSEMGEAGQGEPGSAEQQGDVEIDFDVRVEETGETKEIEGCATEQRIVILRANIKGETEEGEEIPETNMYVINDEWQCDDLPEMQPLMEFQKQAAQVMADELVTEDMSNVISQLMQTDPRVSVAIDNAKRELAKMGGFALRSTMHLVTVPVGEELDLEVALGEEEEKEEKKGRGLGGFLKRAAEAQAGLDSGDESSAEQLERKQTTLFSMHNRIQDISTEPRPDNFFRVPDDYEEIEYEKPEFTMPGQ